MSIGGPGFTWLPLGAGPAINQIVKMFFQIFQEKRAVRGLCHDIEKTEIFKNCNKTLWTPRLISIVPTSKFEHSVHKESFIAIIFRR